MMGSNLYGPMDIPNSPLALIVWGFVFGAGLISVSKPTLVAPAVLRSKLLDASDHLATFQFLP